jgi:hypothetical protein
VGIGRVEARRIQQLGSVVAARLLSLSADTGDRVQAGQQVGQLDPVNLPGQLLSGGSHPGALEYVAGGNTGVPMGLLAPGAEGKPSRESVPEAVRALGALAWISSQGVLRFPFRPIALRQKRWCKSDRLQLKQLLLQPLPQAPLHQIA